MNQLNELLKNLKHATDRLNQLHVGGQNPWQSFTQMQDVFGQEFWSNLNQLSQIKNEQTVTTAPPDRKPEKFVPSVDVFQTLKRVIVCCQIPGLDKNSLKINVKNGELLVIQGIIKEHHLSDYRVVKERVEGPFSRQIPLPSTVSSESVKSSYRDGLLELQFIKKETVSPQTDNQNLHVDL